jgi:hypothetical protein
MEVSNDAFTDYEEWMVILYDDILMCGNTINVAYEAYENLNLVLQWVHNLSIVLKMSKEWLGFRPVQFFSYKIIGPKIKVTKE